MALAPGEVFAGYTILRLLGSGGMGEVYLARHPRLPRQEALKIVRNDISAGDNYRERFIREADLAAALWHPNIIHINDRGEFNEQLWISMDFVDGTAASTLLRNRYPVGMPADEVAAILAGVASALDYAHQHQLLHRDIKPENILLTNSADGDRRILLGDFGIARKMGDISGLTATSMTIGTIPYAAPEQLVDEPIDGRADQYALAATAYHLLTGSPVFPHTNPAVVISHHLTLPPPPLSDTRPELAAFDPVLARALAKDPGRRFARCTDFARAFAEALAAGDHARASAPTRPVPVASRPPKGLTAASDASDVKARERRPMVVGAASAAVALMAVGVIGYSIENDAAASKPDRHAAVLDGTYRLDSDSEKQTANGAPDPQASSTSRWAFRSACTSTGCVAIGTQLDDKNHLTAQTRSAVTGRESNAGKHFRYVNGSWQGGPDRRQVQHQQCLGPNGTVVAGSDTELWTWSLAPQPDGTLRGNSTVTVLTNECSLQGSVLRSPVVATRLGDLPRGVTLADPATVSSTAPTETPTPAVAGPTLDGTYRVDYDDAGQTVNGAPATGSPNITHWWAFRSSCTSAGCIATGAQLSDTNHYEATGAAEALRFVDGHWQDTPRLESPAPCPPGPSTTASDTDTLSWSWTPEPNGTLRGVLTDTVLTGNCGDRGSVYKTPMLMTRVGDVPAAVTVADRAWFTDPALFNAPAPATDGRH